MHAYCSCIGHSSYGFRKLLSMCMLACLLTYMHTDILTDLFPIPTMYCRLYCIVCMVSNLAKKQYSK